MRRQLALICFAYTTSFLAPTRYDVMGDVYLISCYVAAVQECLHLCGWCDQGSYFQLRASSAMQPDLMSEFEVEQLLLAPREWSNACCSMFGISMEGLQVSKRWNTTQEACRE